jgi:hypothetical protein
MIRVKAAFNSETGEMLDTNTAFRGGTTPEASIEAIADVIARMAHHALAIHGDDMDFPALVARAGMRAVEIFSELPTITDKMRDSAEDANDDPDPEPDYCTHPSGDDEQILTAGIMVRANGYEVAMVGAGAERVAFDHIPMASANLVGAITAHALTALVTPANIEEDEGAALGGFKAAWEINMALAQGQKQARKMAVHERRVRHLLTGKLDEEN